jgi:hypothetical protein
MLTPSAGQFHAVVVARSSELLLLGKIERRGTDVYVSIPHCSKGTQLDDGTLSNPHVSYHASGQHHMKAYRQYVFTPDRRQRPDINFTGSEPIYDLGLGPGDWGRSPFVTDASAYADLFQVCASDLTDRDSYCVSLHLVAPEGAPKHTPYSATLVAHHTFRSLPPHVHASLWRIQTPAPTR